MQHKISGRRLSRTASHLKAMKRNMVTSLIMEERINTTVQKAKEIRIVAEKLVTLAKRGNLHARRQAATKLRGAVALRKLFDEYSKRFANRNGGYTRIIKNGFRNGDNAEMAFIEFLPSEQKVAENVAGESAQETTSDKKKSAPKKATAKKKESGASSGAKPKKEKTAEPKAKKAEAKEKKPSEKKAKKAKTKEE